MLYLILCLAATPLLVFCSYVALLRVASVCSSMSRLLRDDHGPIESITSSPINFSIMITARDINDNLIEKLESLVHELSSKQVENIIVGLDGARVSDTNANLKPRLDALLASFSILFYESPLHVGKNAVINQMLPLATGNVLIFTDVDAKINPKSFMIFNQWFSDPAVGAVVGLRVIVDDSEFGSAQSAYVDLDTKIKNWEMKCLGSVTSCDGKLYAIRSNLVETIPLHVTDDAYIGLGAPLNKKRLVFDDRLVAEIGRPAKSPVHEFERRRRVTTRGLHSLCERKKLFDLTRHGWYSYCLFSNKVCRRFAPISLALLLSISMFMFGYRAGVMTMGIIVVLIFGGFLYLNHITENADNIDSQINQRSSIGSSKLVSWLFLNRRTQSSKLIRAGSYFAIGMVAMSLGLIDFFRGKKVSKWEPRKKIVPCLN